MASFNSITLLGNLTRDIELRQTPGGSVVCDVGLAVNEKHYSKAKDEMVENVCFIDCTLFGKKAELANEYLRKGSQVLFQGRLQQDTWQDKESGANRSKHKIMVDVMTFVGGRSEGGQDNRSEAEKFYDRPPANSDPDEDVPF